MYDIRQFKPALFLVVVLGLTGYALAAEAAGLWVFSLALVLSNAWLVRQGTFRPIPRALANAVTVLAFGYAFLQVRTHGDSPILAIGQFLVLLQIVKVWEQRANRDHAQLLVLSLLLMVAAAISTASLLFGLLFVAYLLTSLYCCLLFHLKVEADDARTSAQGAPQSEPDAGRPAGADARREGDRDLAASMRRLTGLISAYALVSAVVVFLFFPRGPGAGVFAQFTWRSRDTRTGFSEQLSFQNVAKIKTDDSPMGTVRVSTDGVARPFASTVLLRGLTDDYYSGGNASGDHGVYQWSHAPSEDRQRPTPMADQSGTFRPPVPAAAGDRGADGGDDPAAGAIVQEVELNPTGTPVLFALAGLTQVRVEEGGPRVRRLNYSGADQTLRTDDDLRQPIRYTVNSTGRLNDQPPLGPVQSVIDPAIGRYARRPEVTGGLAAARDREAAARPDGGRLGYVSPLDAQIAGRVEAYLKHNFAYTLDLSDLGRIKGDPIVAFLTDFKRGHCEYFAGAMTLLCQSLGMEARLVIGFKVDDYNPFGHYYTIRQSQAHTWVEVRTTDGWQPYDPTGGSDAGQVASASLWQRTKNLVDFMEYTWQRSVISYNADNRDNLIQSVDARLTNSTIRSSSVLLRFRDAMERAGAWVSANVVRPVIVLVTLAAVGWFARERYRLRRRAARIGVGDLPPGVQARLVRQLAFYDGLVRLLARHRIARPPHLTPMEFSRTLSFLPPAAYDTIARLTGVFYRIRFGGADLDDGRQRRLLAAVDRLEGMMPVANGE